MAKRIIGQVIKGARLKLDLSAEEVGKACNVSRSRIYQWEAADYVFKKNLGPLAAALHLQVRQLERVNGHRG